MRKTIVSVLCLLGGCASFGQFHYSGNSKVPVLEEVLVCSPSTQNGMRSHSFNYWNSVAQKTISISNPYKYEINVSIFCQHVLLDNPVHITIPAQTTQYMLVSVSMNHAHDKLCQMQIQ